MSNEPAVHEIANEVARIRLDFERRKLALELAGSDHVSTRLICSRLDLARKYLDFLERGNEGHHSELSDESVVVRPIVGSGIA